MGPHLHELASNQAVPQQFQLAIELWEPNLLPLAEFADIRIVHCTAPTALIHQRITTRADTDPHRHAHHDSSLVTAITTGGESPIDTFDPVQLDVPALTVDTSSGYRPDLDTITRFATGA